MTTLAGSVNQAIPGLRSVVEVQDDTEPVVVVPVVGRVPVAVGGSAVLRIVVPATAAQNTRRCRPCPL